MSRNKLAPILFNIYIDDLFEICKGKNENIDIQAYADDILITLHGKELQVVYQKAQIILNKIEKWCNNKSLKISTNKTKYMIITNNNKEYEIKSLNIGKSQIQLVQEYKYLGIIIDNKLKWDKHVNFIKNKIQKYIPIMYQLRNILPKEMLLTIY